MRVLIACEFSGVVRDAFIARGHEAVSCDLLPTESPGPHIQGDVLPVLGQGWDLMIAHPPCTYLCSSGLHWNKRRPERAALTEDALEFVARLLDAPIPRIALENPIGCISSRIRKPDQVVQPWWFGDDASKATCWWLKNLPKLKQTAPLLRPYWIICECCEDYWCQIHNLHAYDCECPTLEEFIDRGDDPYTKYYGNQTPSGQNKLGPSPDRAKLRSTTYPGMALAMAAQWGGFS